MSSRDGVPLPFCLVSEVGKATGSLNSSLKAGSMGCFCSREDPSGEHVDAVIYCN